MKDEGPALVAFACAKAADSVMLVMVSHQSLASHCEIDSWSDTLLSFAQYFSVVSDLRRTLSVWS